MTESFREVSWVLWRQTEKKLMSWTAAPADLFVLSICISQKIQLNYILFLLQECLEQSLLSLTTMKTFVIFLGVLGATKGREFPFQNIGSSIELLKLVESFEAENCFNQLKLLNESFGNENSPWANESLLKLKFNLTLRNLNSHFSGKFLVNHSSKHKVWKLLRFWWFWSVLER